ncbi:MULTISPECIES: hypothetical protein [Prauserella salsuginis group]|uniref:Uncharacterized protein n=2 Tax=Prauserella salsuginis group TaxID=2893672 RepID=A0A839XRX8_9PSEU|nr:MULTISPECIES: hypothetical protein [Prauserella salsuginis group]MBB3663708.1 hypothetical protein [Prauserella sediminis]MCR3722511.1 hypothetical protein [Prauserella flava]MCR3736953.1 hypothetical protein [Prauserella salsuginis]
MTRRTVIPVVFAVGAMLGIASPAAAQEESATTTLTRADVSVTMNDGADDVLRATYELGEPTTEATPVTLLLLPRDNAEITELTAVSGLTELGPTNGIRADATLPAGTSEYTVEQRVRRADGEHGLPLAIPDIATARTANVNIEITLPPGMRLTGDSLPSYNSGTSDDDRTVLHHRGHSLPSVLVAEYGNTSRASIGFWSSTVGLVLVTVVIIAWAYHSFRKERVRR